MPDVVQIVIISVITILTIVIAMVGMQAYFLLKETRGTIEKTNNILDDTHVISSKFAQSTESISGALVGLKAVLALIGLVKKKKNNEE